MAVEQIRTINWWCTGICPLHRTWKATSWQTGRGRRCTEATLSVTYASVINHPNPMGLPMRPQLLVACLLLLKVFHQEGLYEKECSLAGPTREIHEPLGGRKFFHELEM